MDLADAEPGGAFRPAQRRLLQLRSTASHLCTGGPDLADAVDIEGTSDLLRRAGRGHPLLLMVRLLQSGSMESGSGEWIGRRFYLQWVLVVLLLGEHVVFSRTLVKMPLKVRLLPGIVIR